MRIKLDDGVVIDTATLKYVYADVDRHDRVRIYVKRKRGARKVRLRELASVEAFMAAYRAALAAPPAPALSVASPAPGSLRWACEQYYRSTVFLELDKSTRAARRGILDAICHSRGHLPIARMESRHIEQIRDEKAAYPEAANGRVKALRQLLKWARHPEVRLVNTNPAMEVSYLLSNNPDGFHTWTVEEVRQFEACHAVGSKPRLALALLMYTGVRRSDVVRLGRQMERDGSLVFRETKGRKKVVKERVLPILPALRAVIDATPASHLTYLVTAFGRPFTSNGFGNWFRRRCRDAALPYCSAHGLRKAAATFAAEAGATVPQLCAIFGWLSWKQAMRYVERANQKKLASDAMHLVLPPEQKMAESLPPLDVMASGGRNRGKKS